jgi:hypothetical protein
MKEQDRELIDFCLNCTAPAHYCNKKHLCPYLAKYKHIVPTPLHNDTCGFKDKYDDLNTNEMRIKVRKAFKRIVIEKKQ